VKTRSENTFYVVFMLFMGFWLRQSLLLTSRKASQFDTGVNFFPVALSVLMIVLTAYLLIKNIYIASTSVQEGKESSKSIWEGIKSKESLQAIGSFFIVLIFLLIYVVLLTPLKFGLSTFIFLILMNLLISKLSYGQFIDKKKFWLRLIIFAIFSFGLPVVFRHVFRLILP
jgi:hypothetical protein